MQSTTVRLSEVARSKLADLCRLRQWSQSDFFRYAIEKEWRRNQELIKKSEELAAAARQEETMDYKRVYTPEQYAEEFTGASAKEIRAEWGGQTLDEIRASVADFWPGEADNDYLAECIHKMVSD